MKISEAVISAATESIHWPEWTTLVANSNGMRYDPEPSAAGVPTVIPSLVKKSRDFRSEHPASARTLRIITDFTKGFMIFQMCGVF